jgi:hypothetical protein
MTVWFLNELAFLPIEVLIVSLIFQKIFEDREKKERFRKINMLIGIFFSDLGMIMLELFSRHDMNIMKIKNEMIVRSNWSLTDFKKATDELQDHPYKIDISEMDLVAIRDFLKSKRDMLIKLLENPTLIEHETFTELLLAVFHVIEELDRRKALPVLNKADSAHIAADMQRAYRLMFFEWLLYMEHLKKNYPYLFSFAMRTNPFDPNAVVEIQDT